MIRINLLPFRAARQKENIRQQVSVFVLMMVFFILALIYYTIHMDKKIDQIKSETDVITAQIALFKEKADKVTLIMKNLAILEQKLQIVKTLELRRWEPLELLDTMTSLVVPKRMWLTSLKTEHSTVTLNGIAFDNKTVADFMTRLELSHLFNSVDLNNIKMTMVDKTIQMNEFELLCQKKVAPEGLEKIIDVKKDVKK